MDEKEFTNLILSETINYHPDIVFLKNRMIYLFKIEDYERMSKIKKWIDELIIYHSKTGSLAHISQFPSSEAAK